MRVRVEPTALALAAMTIGDAADAVAGLAVPPLASSVVAAFPEGASAGVAFELESALGVALDGLHTAVSSHAEALAASAREYAWAEQGARVDVAAARAS